ncbi:hypothetical protein AA12717_2763 [Gluconacetobacter sacchari DSM 12717]|uniref:Uncharacterized protein n=1 Tax=Gluconacetobacter sacchari DSM 12717 TaxID=1307940 RepID=A0ABQ0P9H1_9PROT|nr:hypothetical protein AA12717_2763 [Gluconacetobacter sacchari DSM 12717]
MAWQQRDLARDDPELRTAAAGMRHVAGRLAPGFAGMGHGFALYRQSRDNVGGAAAKVEVHDAARGVVEYEDSVTDHRGVHFLDRKGDVDQRAAGKLSGACKRSAGL